MAGKIRLMLDQGKDPSGPLAPGGETTPIISHFLTPPFSLRWHENATEIKDVIELAQLRGSCHYFGKMQVQSAFAQYIAYTITHIEFFHLFKIRIRVAI